MARVFRNSDAFARLGGDEFAVRQSNIQKARAEESVERFRAALEAYTKAAGRGDEIAFSTGVVGIAPGQTDRA